MADIPIIFSAPMISALLAGQKTMTRRLAWRRVIAGTDSPKSWGLGVHCGDGSTLLPTSWQRVKPGDRLWVRENHQFRGADYGDSDGEIEWFRVYGSGGAFDNWDPKFPNGWEPTLHAGVRELTEPDEQEGDDIKGYVTKLFPSIHMPRWTSRITILITATKKEPLQDIDEADADAEGIVTIPRSLTRHGRLDGYGAPGTLPEDASTTRVNGYRALWRKLHGAASWDENPEVVVMAGRVVVANIDSAEARHG